MITYLALLLSSANLIDERRCQGKQPQRVTLAELNANVSGFEGRCVAVAGRSLAGSLVEGEADRAADGMPRLRLGLYQRDGAEARSTIAREGGMWEVTGAVDSCDRIARQVRADHEREVAEALAAGTIQPPPPMLAGSCHHHGGPVIWIASYRRLLEEN